VTPPVISALAASSSADGASATITWTRAPRRGWTTARIPRRSRSTSRSARW
jgi:hypothetical protein